MVIYMHTDHGSAYDADFARLGLMTNVRILDLSAGGDASVKAAVRAMTDAGVAGIVVPDDVKRHTPPLEIVKQCAHHLDLQVSSVTRYIHNQQQPERTSGAAPTPVSPHGKNGVAAAALQPQPHP